jgi:hypothetical protein
VKHLVLGVCLAALVVACSDSSPVGPSSNGDPREFAIATGDVAVTTNADGGAGSFRAAIEAANADPSIQSIAFNPSVSEVRLASGVVFTGTQPLTIFGNHAAIDGTNVDSAAFITTGGGDLTLVNLTVQNAPAEGVQVNVPTSATGTITLTLTGVDIVDNQGHGFVVNDQEDPTTIEDVQPDPDGSDAAIEVVVTDSRFLRNGFSVSDRDGLRVNEGGVGDLSITLTNVHAEDNAADGVEVDERGTGDVHLNVSGTTFVRNGKFDPEDLDDGFDVDEYDDGSILGTIVNSTASHNFEEGFDINENNAGDLRVNFDDVAAGWDGEEGIDLEEDDDFGGGGDVVVVARHIRTQGNGDGADGALKIREKEAGNLNVTLSDILSTGNIGSGVFVRESSGGNAVISIDGVVSNGNEAGALDPFSLGHGLELLESGAGSFTATVNDATVSANAGNGVFADGSGTVTLTNLRGSGNALGLISGSATVLP